MNKPSIEQRSLREVLKHQIGELLDRIETEGEWGHFNMDILHPSVTGSLSRHFLVTFRGKPDLQSLSNGKFFTADLFR